MGDCLCKQAALGGRFYMETVKSNDKKLAYVGISKDLGLDNTARGKHGRRQKRTVKSDHRDILAYFKKI